MSGKVIYDYIRHAATEATWWLMIGSREWHFPYAATGDSLLAVDIASFVARWESVS